MRRDFCNFQQHTYGAVLDVLLYRQDLDQALRVMDAQLQLLIDKKIAFDDLILSRKLAKEYKNENNAQNVVAKKVEQRTPGGGPLPGDRVEFVMVALAWSNEKDPMYKRAEDANYARKRELPLDLKYYIDSFKNSMTTLFEPFKIDQRLDELFAHFTAQAKKIVHGSSSASVLKYFQKLPAQRPNQEAKESGPPLRNYSRQLCAKRAFLHTFIHWAFAFW